MCSELKGDIPRLDMLKAQLVVNDAWRDIRDSRLWSFQVAETTLLAPALTSAGSATVTYGSTSVVMDTAATTAINSIPPQTLVTQQQFRVTGGAIYNITAWDPSTSTLTIDRVYAAGTATGGYQIYRCYYGPPSSDFVRWISVFDPVNGYQFTDLTLQKRDIDTWDPLRGAISQPYCIASYKFSTQTVPPSPLFELWPHPQAQIGYMALYQKIGQDLDNVTNPTLPTTIPRHLVMAKARAYAYRWAAANAGRWPELANRNWGILMARSEKEYQDELARTELIDEDTYMQYYSVYRHSQYYLGPLTGSYLQSHDGWGIFGGY